ncbi:putative glycosyltransferase EpsE [compost metagenome]
MANPISNSAGVDLGTSQILSECSLHSATPHVAILMCTYNGERFLEEQLDSFERQTHRHWSLVVSDDGSTDRTLLILDKYKQSLDVGRVTVVSGPQRNFVANFLSLVCRKDISADYYAWSDQDDIWSETKLEAAVAWLQTIPPHIPALYCGRTQLIDEIKKTIGYSPRFCRPPSFSNALVQNIGGGNTMVFNQAARDLLQEAGDNLDVPAHDWWAYQLISGAGGVIYYDPTPQLLYRQHGENIIGSNSGWSARWQRLKMLRQGRFSNWNDQNIGALELIRHRLTDENALTLERFKLAVSQGFFGFLVNLKRSGVYRQTRLGNIGLVVACLIKGK